jgi:hypothetical protein
VVGCVGATGELTFTTQIVAANRPISSSAKRNAISNSADVALSSQQLCIHDSPEANADSSLAEGATRTFSHYSNH